MKPEYLEAFLRQPFIGVLASLRRDGRPYTVPVWWLLRDGSFWLSGTYERVWCKQLARDPRASLCIEATGDFAGHVGIDGRIVRHELPDFDVWPISRLLVEKYVEHGRFKPPKLSDKPQWPHPVVANGVLYIRDQDTLYAYDVKRK